MTIGPRVVAAFTMSNVRADTSRAPRRQSRWIKIAIVPPVQPGTRVKAVAIHVGLTRFSDFGRLYPILFEEVAQVHIILPIAAIGLSRRRIGWESIFQFGRRTCDHIIFGEQVGVADRLSGNVRRDFKKPLARGSVPLVSSQW